MKTVFSSHWDVCHTFAQQEQPEGRANNIFFENNKIYSYGRHYLLAEIIGNDILINDDGYSVSTGKHINIVRSATRQYNQFFASYCSSSLVLSQLRQLFDKLGRALKPEMYINEAENIYENYKEFKKHQKNSKEKFSSMFSYYDDKEIKKLIRKFNKETAKDYVQKKIKAEKQKREKQLKQALKTYKEQKEKFLNYEINSFYSQPDLNLFDVVRISKDSDKIETNQGVKVSLKAAKLLFNLIKNGKDIKGYNIEGFTVISINGSLKIGCHNIDKTNVFEIGNKILNL